MTLKHTNSILIKHLFSLAIALTILLSFNEAKAQLPIKESFTNSTTSSSMEFGPISANRNKAFLTANATAAGEVVTPGDGTASTAAPVAADVSGRGFLRLTNNTQNQTGYARSLGQFTSDQGVKVEFEYYSYGGSNADGITFFLYNATAIGSFQIGSFGGSLGYAQKVPFGIPEPGVSKGFIGIGLDEYGNFASDREGRAGGPPVDVRYSGGGAPYYGGGPSGYYPSAVVLRGSGNGTGNASTNYEFLERIATINQTHMTDNGAGSTFTISDNAVSQIRTGLTGPNGTIGENDKGYRKVIIDLKPNLLGPGGLTSTGFLVTVTVKKTV